MNLETTKKEIDVDSRTFLLNDFHANILFDFGTNCSFISHKFSRRLAFSIDRLHNTLIVEVASGKFVLVSECMKNIVINLNGNKFHKELLPTKLNSFDIVLGMDWLSVNDVVILCRKKMVRVLDIK